MLLILALALGGLQFIAPKGTALHRAVGYAWVALMAGLCLFWLRSRHIGALPHAVGLAGLFLAPIGLACAQNNRLRSHAAVMVTLFTALLLAGTLAIASSGAR